MKTLFISLFSCALFFCACSKQEQKDNNKVNIRIKNETNLLLQDVKVSNTSFGNIAAGTTSDYSVVSEPIYAGYCTFKTGEMLSFAGYGVCGTPMPPAFGSGYYTFKVEPGGQGYFGIIVTHD